MTAQVNRELKWAVATFLGALVPFLFFKGYGQRFTYLPLLGFSVMAAVALLPKASKTAGRFLRLKKNPVWAFATIIVFLNFFVLLERNVWWARAGKTSQAAMTYAWAEISRLPAGSAACFTGLPSRLHGAYVFKNGFVEAMYAFHPVRQADILIVHDEDLDPQRLESIGGCSMFRYEQGTFRRIY